MKYTLNIVLISIGARLFPTQTINAIKVPEDKVVFFCNGQQSKKYHFVKNSAGLRNCSTDIEKITESLANDKGRTLCGNED